MTEDEFGLFLATLGIGPTSPPLGEDDRVQQYLAGNPEHRHGVEFLDRLLRMTRQPRDEV